MEKSTLLDIQSMLLVMYHVHYIHDYETEGETITKLKVSQDTLPVLRDIMATKGWKASITGHPQHPSGPYTVTLSAYSSEAACPVGDS